MTDNKLGQQATRPAYLSFIIGHLSSVHFDFGRVLWLNGGQLIAQSHLNFACFLSAVAIKRLGNVARTTRVVEGIGWERPSTRESVSKGILRPPLPGPRLCRHAAAHQARDDNRVAAAGLSHAPVGYDAPR